MQPNYAFKPTVLPSLHLPSRIARRLNAALGAIIPMRDSFTFTWTPNIDDTYAGMSLAAWGSGGRTARTLFFTFVLPALFAAWILHEAIPRTVSLIVAAGSMALAWGVLFLFGFRILFGRYVLKRQLALSERVDVVVTETGVEHRGVGVTTHVAWSVVTSIEELPRVFILHSGNRIVGAIEKSGITSAVELQELREFLKPRGLSAST